MGFEGKNGALQGAERCKALLCEGIRRRAGGEVRNGEGEFAGLLYRNGGAFHPNKERDNLRHKARTRQSLSLQNAAGGYVATIFGRILVHLDLPVDYRYYWQHFQVICGSALQPWRPT